MDQGLNWELARAVNGLAGHFGVLDKIMVLGAKYLIVLVFLSVGIWWFLPSANDAGKRAALAAVVAVVLGQLLNVTIAHFVFVPRPFIAHNVQLLVNAARDSSFPSDHSTAAFGVAITALLWRMPGRRLYLLAAVLIGSSRVFVGAHYPADVAAGAVLGAIWAALAFKLDSLLVHPYGWVISLARRMRLA